MLARNVMVWGPVPPSSVNVSPLMAAPAVSMSTVPVMTMGAGGMPGMGGMGDY